MTYLCQSHTCRRRAELAVRYRHGGQEVRRILCVDCFAARRKGAMGDAEPTIAHGADLATWSDRPVMPYAAPVVAVVPLESVVVPLAESLTDTIVLPAPPPSSPPTESITKAPPPPSNPPPKRPTPMSCLYPACQASVSKGRFCARHLTVVRERGWAPQLAKLDRAGAAAWLGEQAEPDKPKPMTERFGTVAGKPARLVLDGELMRLVTGTSEAEVTHGTVAAGEAGRAELGALLDPPPLKRAAKAAKPEDAWRERARQVRDLLAAEEAATAEVARLTTLLDAARASAATATATLKALVGP